MLVEKHHDAEVPPGGGKMMHLYLLFILTLDWKHQVIQVACGLLGKRKKPINCSIKLPLN